jgi:hypothetical protein
LENPENRGQIVLFPEKDRGTEQIHMKKRNFPICQQCSNKWRDECLVTKPELASSIAGLEKCSHYFQEKNKPKGNKWYQV